MQSKLSITSQSTSGANMWIHYLIINYYNNFIEGVAGMRNPLICNMVEVLSIQDQDKCIPCRSSDEIDKTAEVKGIVEDKGIINFCTIFLTQ